MRGGKENFVARGKEIAAGGAALAGADELGSCGLTVGSVDGHGVDLIAGDAFALVLENELFIIGGKVSFGVLTAESQLAGVFEVLLFLGKENLRSGGLLRVKRSVREEAEADGSQQR